MFPVVLRRFARIPFKIHAVVIIPPFQIEQRIFLFIQSLGLNGDLRVKTGIFSAEPALNRSSSVPAIQRASSIVH